MGRLASGSTFSTCVTWPTSFRRCRWRSQMAFLFTLSWPRCPHSTVLSRSTTTPTRLFSLSVSWSVTVLKKKKGLRLKKRRMLSTCLATSAFQALLRICMSQVAASKARRSLRRKGTRTLVQGTTISSKESNPKVETCCVHFVLHPSIFRRAARALRNGWNSKVILRLMLFLSLMSYS